MKPLLFVDVDGVLNVLCQTPDGFREAACNGYTIRYDPANAARLRRLAEHFDLVWGTTWEHRANEWIAPLFGLQPLPVCELPVLRDGSTPAGTWKLRDILVYAGDRPFAWIDDMIYGDAHRMIQGKSCALFRTDPARGLDNDAVDMLIGWAAELRSKAAA